MGLDVCGGGVRAVVCRLFAVKDAVLNELKELLDVLGKGKKRNK